LWPGLCSSTETNKKTKGIQNEQLQNEQRVETKTKQTNNGNPHHTKTFEKDTT
jgi:hypothetical protein